MILRVTQYGEPILREVGKPITEFDEALAELANDMVDTMYDAGGIGLAAQQVDRALQIFVLDVRPPEGMEVPFEYSLDGKKPPLELIMPWPSLIRRSRSSIKWRMFTKKAVSPFQR